LLITGRVPTHLLEEFLLLLLKELFFPATLQVRKVLFVTHDTGLNCTLLASPSELSVNSSICLAV